MYNTESVHLIVFSIKTEQLRIQGTYKIIRDRLHRFLKGRSCLANLIVKLNSVCRQSKCDVYTDFQKVFD